MQEIGYQSKEKKKLKVCLVLLYKNRHNLKKTYMICKIIIKSLPFKQELNGCEDEYYQE
jgi:hypothetical protein